MKFPLLYLKFLDYGLGCLPGSPGGFVDKFKDLNKKRRKKP